MTNYLKLHFETRDKYLKRLGFKSYIAYLDSDLWKNERARLKKQKKFQNCFCCGSDKNIDLHHISYAHIANGKKQGAWIWPLCRRCHYETHDLLKANPFRLSLRTAAKRIKKKYSARNSKTRPIGENLRCLPQGGAF